MSLDNLFGFTPGWKVDPTQDRRAGPVITYTLTPEELQKRYGHIKTSEKKPLYTGKEVAEWAEKKKEERKMKNVLGVDLNRAMSICLAYGTGKDASAVIASEYGITQKQAQNYITSKGIRSKLMKEVEDEYFPKEDDAVVKPEPSGIIPISAAETQRIDVVNHPAHYNKGKYEVIDIMESILNSMTLKPFEAYCLGNVIKYVSRCKLKNGDEDLRKARWYLDKLLEEKEV